MKLILLKDFKALGKKGDIVEVNDGYARNFLIPNKVGMVATKDAQNERNQRLENERKREELERAQALELFKTINKKEFDVPVKCNDTKMYGSVTNIDVAAALSKAGFEVDKKNIRIKDAIKSLGKHEIEVWCYKETVAKIVINVIPQK